MIDLHMHSSCSIDGSYTPEELAELCAEKQLKIMALSDHNTIEGVRKAQAAAEARGIVCIPAIEFDCTLNAIDLHIVGYGVDIEAEAHERIRVHAMAEESNCSMAKLIGFRQLGFEISEEEIEAASAGCLWPNVWTGEMFAEVLLGRKDLAEHPLLKPYRSGGARSDNPYVNFHWDFCGQGKPCYTPQEWPAAEEVIRTIHEVGGKAVLAHPGQNLNGSTEAIRVLAEMGLDAVEAFSSYHTQAQAAEYMRAAEALSLTITGGSDFHGKIKPNVRLCGYTIPEGIDAQKIIMSGLEKMQLV